MKALYVIPLAFLLTACNSTSQNITTTKQIVVMPDEALYNCPIVKRFPDSSKLTDVQVARTLVELYKNNVTCKNSIDAIRKFLEDSKASIEQ